MRNIRYLVCALLACGYLQALHAAPVKQAPNIVYIMMDDLDISDVGAYGSPDIKTETIDTVAAQGMRLDRYYVNSPVCAPTEASILTGQHPSRFGFKRAVLPDSKRGIPGDVATVAQVLKTAGYRTAHIGKWFVGTQKPEFLPPAKGFDRSVRFVTDDNLSYLTYKLSFDEGSPVLFDDGKHLTERLTDSAIEFIENSQTEHPASPFFVNLWYFAPHRPIQPPANFDNSETGYCLTPNSAGESCNTERGNYAALVTYADRQIKRVLETLDKLGVAKNTLVLITSDNGGDRYVHPSELLPDRELRGFKAGLFDGGIRVPMVIRWPGVVADESSNKSVIASFDALPTLAEIANVRVDNKLVDGSSFLEVLKSNILKKRDQPLVWENKISNSHVESASGILNTYAIRDGDWKLVFTPAVKPGRSDRTMLFNLANDPAEQHDLLADGIQPLREFTFQDYRFELSKQVAKPGVLKSTVSQPAVNYLKSQYFNWRRKIGTISYEAKLSATGVVRDKDSLTFNGGAATVWRNTRFDFHDGDFSFLSRFKAADVNTPAVLAEKPGSWRLATGNSLLKLSIYGSDASEPRTVTLTAPIKAGQNYHVSFTVFGFRNSGSTIKLYLNGRQVAEHSDALLPAGKAGISGVKAVDELNKPMLYIGNSSRGDIPFTGTIEIPRMLVLSLYPGEVFWDYADLAR